MAVPTVEILYFEGCPNHHAARELVERVAEEVGMTPDLQLIEVPRPEDAERMRFLGSPTIRVNGHDVEAGADERLQFQYACRIYDTDSGFAGLPPAEWVHLALTRT